MIKQLSRESKRSNLISTRSCQVAKVFCSLHLINLYKFSITKQNILAAAVYSFYVHAQGHKNLKITVCRIIISYSDFHCLIVYLNNSEIFLHLFLQNGMVEDSDACWINSWQYILAATPLNSLNVRSLTFYWCSSFPAIWVIRRICSNWFTAPHNNVTIFRTTSKHFVFWV